MGGKPAAGSSRDQIDTPILWMVVRGAEILYGVAFAKMAYLSHGTASFLEDAISTAGLFLVMVLFLHRVVTGWADTEGIHYRRYFQWKTLAWSEVQEIQWKGPRLRVLVRGRKQPKAVLEFLLNPWKSIGTYWVHRLGAAGAPPAILERIRALPIEASPPMNSTPPMSPWIKRFFVSLWIVFGLIFLMRLFWASQGDPH